jgi:hypothetical protein
MAACLSCTGFPYCCTPISWRAYLHRQPSPDTCGPTKIGTVWCDRRVRLSWSGSYDRWSNFVFHAIECSRFSSKCTCDVSENMQKSLLGTFFGPTVKLSRGVIFILNLFADDQVNKFKMLPYFFYSLWRSTRYWVCSFSVAWTIIVCSVVRIRSKLCKFRTSDHLNYANCSAMWR